MTRTPTTADELRAAMADVPGDAQILLILHSAPDSLGAPLAGWLGQIRYDPGARTVDLHDTDACSTSPGLLPVLIPTADEDAPGRCT